jgi:hypothetical protein
MSFAFTLIESPGIQCAALTLLSTAMLTLSTVQRPHRVAAAAVVEMTGQLCLVIQFSLNSIIQQGGDIGISAAGRAASAAVAGTAATISTFVWCTATSSRNI